MTVILVFFTPVLGLFDTLMLSQFKNFRGYQIPIFDIQNGTYVSIEDAWAPYKLGSDSDIINWDAISSVMKVTACFALVVHLVGIQLIRRLFLCKGSLFVWKDLYCCICPPLLYDWHSLMRSSSENIDALYRKSVKALGFYVALFATEHLLLSVPVMAVLKVYTAER